MPSSPTRLALPCVLVSLVLGREHSGRIRDLPKLLDGRMVPKYSTF